MSQQRRLGNLSEIEPHRVIDKIRVQSLQDVEISLEIDLGLDLPRKLRLDLFGHIDFVLDADGFGDEGIDLPNVIGLQRVAHSCKAPTGTARWRAPREIVKLNKVPNRSVREPHEDNWWAAIASSCGDRTYWVPPERRTGLVRPLEHTSRHAQRMPSPLVIGTHNSG